MPTSRTVPADGPGAPVIGRLTGFRVGVTSDRRSGDLISAFERRGAEVMHGPALRISAHEDDEAVAADTRAVLAAGPDVVLVTTGYGMRRWLDVADAAGLGTQLTAALDRARVMVRGPKALGAVRAAGVDHVRTTQHDTTADMVDDLLRSGARSLRVVVQLHGLGDDEQLERLRGGCARVLTVSPYRSVRPLDDDRLDRLVEAACSGQLDAVTFTSAPAAAAVLQTAGTLGRGPDLVAALRGDVLAAAVGPVTAAPLVEAGVRPVVPDRYRLGALIRLVCEELGRRQVVRLRAASTTLELRGRAVVVGDQQVRLPPSGLAILRRLATAEGVVSRQELLACLPEAADEHALDVAVSRLRQALGTPGLISTVVKRGYRLDAARTPG